MSLKLLPKWIIPDSTPSAYDTESVTNLEAIAKTRAKMNELINEYNNFVDSCNEVITSFMSSSREDLEVFESALRQEFQDFIDIVNIKYKDQEDLLNSVLETASVLTEKAVKEWLDEHPEATTTVEDGTITYTKLHDNLKESAWLRCSEIGMTTDDSDSQNIHKLTSAINEGHKIIVDGSYNIVGGTPEDIKQDIVIKGLYKGCGFNDNREGGVMFNVSKDVRFIEISLLNFVNLGGGNAKVLHNTSSGANDLNIERMIISNCSFEDGFSLYRQSGARLYNISETLSSVKEFIFTHNEVKNCNFSFCDMSNVCFDNVEITSNRVNNFKYVLFGFGTENLPSGYTDENYKKYKRLGSNKRKVLADNNYVVCDDDCIMTENQGSYYCFLLTECQTTVYTNNHVEGLKASATIATYDAYLSSTNVVVENNVWKNIVCFSSSKVNNTLMKAKGGSGVRVFKHNKYSVTEDFLSMLQSKYSAEIKNCWVELISITEASVWDITENVIEIASILRFFQSNPPLKKYTFSNNFISAHNLSGNCFFVPAYDKCTTIFTDNIINSEEFSSTHFLFGEAKEVNSCVADKNTINIPKAQMNIILSGSYKSYFVCENKFTCNSTKYWNVFETVDNELTTSSGDSIFASKMSGTKQKNHINFVDVQAQCLPLNLNFSDDVNEIVIIHLRRISKTTGDYKEDKWLFRSYFEADVKKLSITNLLTGEIKYDDVLNPETAKQSSYGMLYVTLRPITASQQSGFVLYVSSDCFLDGSYEYSTFG